MPAVLRELVLQRLARLLYINLDTDAIKVTNEIYKMLKYQWGNQEKFSFGSTYKP